MKTDNNQVVIVGAGMAGLTAAAYLTRKNVDVLLLEKNDKTGGLLGSFEKNGFFFDSGPRALVNSGIKSYGAAKLAQLLSMLKFSDHFNNSGVTINAMHPGNVQTSSGQNNNAIYKFLKRAFIDSNARPISVAADSLYYLGVSKELDQVTGKFFNLTTEEEPSPPALDKVAAEELWNISLKLGGLYEN